MCFFGNICEITHPLIYGNLSYVCSTTHCPNTFLQEIFIHTVTTDETLPTGVVCANLSSHVVWVHMYL